MPTMERPEHRKVTTLSAPIQTRPRESSQSKKIETRNKVHPEIGSSMEQQASGSCKMSGGSSATRQQERIGRGSACPDFRGSLVLEGPVE